ncbi:MAG: RNA-binding domain-containing protein, partial [Candidatus Micrarchaeia archaeon]
MWRLCQTRQKRLTPFAKKLFPLGETVTDLSKDELITRLQDIEWEDFEVKEARNEVPKNAWETVSAFSNTAGGWIIFGAKKEGKKYEITGCSEPDKTESDFLTVLNTGNKFNKRIDVTPKKYAIDDKTVLVFYIPQRNPREKPVYFDSPKNTFVRTGSGDRRATQEEIDSFFRNASFGKKDGEQTRLAFNDLDHETVKQYRNLFAQTNPGHRYLNLADKAFLEKLSATNHGRVTYAGLLIFGTYDAIRRKLPHYRVEYLEIAGTSYTDAATRYNYRISSESNLFQTFFQIYSRLSKTVEIPFSVSQGIRNDDPPHLQALREALVNLLIHSDYFSNATPRIRVFSDRIEFFNPGALPKRIELILEEEFSMPRNPIITKTFRLVKLADNIGSGFAKMVDGWQAHYKNAPH